MFPKEINHLYLQIFFISSTGSFNEKELYHFRNLHKPLNSELDHSRNLKGTQILIK